MNEREGDYIHVLTRVQSHLPLEGGYWNHGSDKSLPVVQYTNPWYGHMSTDSTTTSSRLVKACITFINTSFLIIKFPFFIILELLMNSLSAWRTLSTSSLMLLPSEV